MRSLSQEKNRGDKPKARWIYWRLDRKDEARQEYEKVKRDAAKHADMKMMLEEAEDLLEINSSESNVEPPTPEP